MSSQDSAEEERGEGTSAASSNKFNPPSSSSHNNGEEMKRVAAKQLIERYYYQLTDGCGQGDCSNDHCASSRRFQHSSITRDQAAIKALDLFKHKAQLCESAPSKVPKSSSADQGASSAEVSTTTTRTRTTSSVIPQQETQQVAPPVRAIGTESSSASSARGYTFDQVEAGFLPTASSILGNEAPPSSSKTSASDALHIKEKEVPYLSEEKLHLIIEECDSEGSWSKLIHTIGSTFNMPESLQRSFLKPQSPSSLSKEELSSLHMDLDKDMDEQEKEGRASSPRPTDEQECEGSSVDGPVTAVSKPASKAKSSTSLPSPTSRTKEDSLTVDIESVRRAFKELFEIPDLPFQGALVNALIYLCRHVDRDLRYWQAYDRNPDYLNIFVIVFEIPVLDSPEFIDGATPHLCKAAGLLPVPAQARLARLWSRYSKERLKALVHCLQQLITVRVITTEWTPSYLFNDDGGITGAARVMKIIFYASLLGGQNDPADILDREKVHNEALESHLHDFLEGAVGLESKEKVPPKDDPLAKALGVEPLNCREPLVAWEEFINEPLSEQIKMDKDYTYYKAETEAKFTFMAHSFLLTPAVKNMGMYFDNRIRMMNERRASLLQSLVHGAPSMPYLRLRIRRDHIIDDALVALEMVAMDNPQDLKKQLYVEFEGEQGIDEGGVSKEFFQLVVEEIFNPDIGMFTYNDETKQFWFNPTSFENDAQFTLIGIMLGLAIYNNVILDVHFPMVVYRKLMGKLGIFRDLFDSHPNLARGLQELLDYEGDVEETFMQTFNISYTDIFGSTLSHCIKPGAEQTPVTEHNRQEYVDMYADFLLNQSIEKQFGAFKRGFQMVTDESPLKMLFRPDEVETLVCGSQVFDFHALQEAAEYDGGFTEDSVTVRNFWEVVHDFSLEQKQKLLQFSTGSDRAPVGGLSKLKLVIARNGPDSDRLPTSHTCFNVLLLPDYCSKDKMRERLTKAIMYAKGFGML